MADSGFTLRRHYDDLSPTETEAVVDAVADLIVNFLTGHRNAAGPGNPPSVPPQEHSHERSGSPR